MENVAHPPETLEGWYVLHQVYTVSRSRLRQLASGDPAQLSHAAEALAAMTSGNAEGGGWSMVAELVGSAADVMIVHFRPTLDALGAAQREVAALAVMEGLALSYSFLSVTEAGMYHACSMSQPSSFLRMGKAGGRSIARAVRALRDRQSTGVAHRGRVLCRQAAGDSRPVR